MATDQDHQDSSGNRQDNEVFQGRKQKKNKQGPTKIRKEVQQKQGKTQGEPDSGEWTNSNLPSLDSFIDVRVQLNTQLK